MSYFLNQVRRAKLVNDLVALGMPEKIGTAMASFPDDVGSVDVSLGALTNQMMEYAQQVLAGRRGEKTALPEETLIAFIYADEAIITAYKEEAVERGIKSLPIWNEVMAEHIENTIKPDELRRNNRLN